MSHRVVGVSPDAVRHSGERLLNQRGAVPRAAGGIGEGRRHIVILDPVDRLHLGVAEVGGLQIFAGADEYRVHAIDRAQRRRNGDQVA